MKKLLAGLMIFTIVNINSINAQPLKIGSITIGNEKTEGRPLKKWDFLSKKQEIKEDSKANAREEKEFNKVHKKEMKKMKRLSRKYENHHGLSTRRRKEKTGF
jgi:hypothetical protein